MSWHVSGTEHTLNLRHGLTIRLVHHVPSAHVVVPFWLVTLRHAEHYAVLHDILDGTLSLTEARFAALTWVSAQLDAILKQIKEATHV